MSWYDKLKEYGAIFLVFNVISGIWWEGVEGLYNLTTGTIQ